MLKLFRKLSVVAALAVAMVAPAAFADKPPVLDRVIDFKVLKVGMSGNQPPMNTNSRSGQLIGYEVDLAVGRLADLVERVLLFLENDGKGQKDQEQTQHPDHKQLTKVSLLCGR